MPPKDTTPPTTTDTATSELADVVSEVVDNSAAAETLTQVADTPVPETPSGNVAKPGDEPEFDFNTMVNSGRVTPLGIQDEYAGKGGSYRINPQTGIREPVE